ncbi:NAD(P)/FAD-dependent oxidoreductase [Dysgonomonas sp. 216]|uniref:NAD(P)/FAD-dependent oxidoreductase n=1 Tax=Dysgonomonas sp. 216 TaxID=2302934 RepID=UPI0013D2FCCD|nr:NAD(P)/FAD-dependent oxidoreductase [Dysgonomonas sp. 216]
MESITNIPNSKGKKRIVIIGGGFAGLQMAKKINHKAYQVVLIDKVNYYQFQPLFYQVATGGLEPSSISYPHRKAFQNEKDFHFRTCQAKHINSESKIVETTIGEIKYDYLVIATGCDTNFFGNEQLRETTFALKSIPEALLMRNRILMSLENALNAKNEDELKRLLTFVIVGGGATGVELAGALADMKKTILPKDYPELDFSKMEIHLVDASPRLLFGMSENASANAANTLANRGVILHQDKSVKSYEDLCVEISDGTRIISSNVLWVAGIKPNTITGLNEDAYNRGRMVVDECNRVKGYNDIFSIGDTCILISEKSSKGHPQVAQVAMQMAQNLAKNLNRNANKETDFKKFVYSDRGSLATIGRNAAVADLGKFKFSGIVAWWLWLIVHILSIVGMKNKVSVFLDWIWSYLNYDVSLRLLILPKFSNIYKTKDNQ